MRAESTPWPVEAPPHRGVDTRLSSVGTDAVRRAIASHGLTLPGFSAAVWVCLLGRHGVENPVSIRLQTVPADPVRGPGESGDWSEGSGSSAEPFSVELRDDRSVADHLLRVHRLLEGGNAPGFGPEIHGASEFHPPFRIRTAAFGELALEVRDGPHLELTLLHDPTRLDSETARSMAGHLKRLMVNMAMDPDPPLAGVPMLSERELQRLFVEWNPEPTVSPGDRLAQERFEAWARAHPDRIAAVREGAFWTYRELNQRANRLAHHLRAQGIGPDAIVAVRLDRSLDALVGLLGTLKAGAAVLALEPGLSRGDLDRVLTETGARAVVAPTRHFHEFEGTPVFLIGLDSDDVLRVARTEDPAPIGDPDHLAWIPYGWDSPGTSVGAAVEHRQLLHRLSGMQEGLGIEPAASHGILCLPGAPADMWAVLSALTSGGCLHLIPPGGGGWGGGLAEYLARHRIDYLHLATTELAFLPGDGFGPGIHPPTCLIRDSTGEGVPGTDQLARIAAAGCVVLSRSGPVPALEGAFIHRTERATSPPRCVRLPLGRPLPGFRCYVVDASLQPVPIGVPGELLVGGPGLPRGFLNQPELTRDRFVPNPFGSGRVYRTQVRARYRQNGDLELLGPAGREAALPALGRVRAPGFRALRRAPNPTPDADRVAGPPGANTRQIPGEPSDRGRGGRSIHASHTYRWEFDER